MAAPAFARFLPDGGGGAWTSDWVEPGFGVAEVVPSWNAASPPGARLIVEVQGRTPVGFETGWYRLAEWAYDDDGAPRASVPGQEDELAAVAVDTLRTTTPFAAYRLRLIPTGGARVTRAFAVATPAPVVPAAVSEPLSADPVELDVPAFAQTLHTGIYPELGGGGASWCSPASTAMVLAFWERGPTLSDVAWVDSRCPEPAVAHAARFTYDAAYGGCGNWAFNVAYASYHGTEAFVTRLRSLREAEVLLRAGIPLVASIGAGPGELDGYPHPRGTDGHLLVLAGLTGSGDVVVNDPAAGSNAEVRRVYDRAQLERAWLGGSAGAVYVIVPSAAELPPRAGAW